MSACALMARLELLFLWHRAYWLQLLSTAPSDCVLPQIWTLVRVFDLQKFAGRRIDTHLDQLHDVVYLLEFALPRLQQGCCVNSHHCWTYLIPFGKNLLVVAAHATSLGISALACRPCDAMPVSGYGMLSLWHPWFVALTAS
jgi:hypothetical protein